jgi:quinoprotein glucose dehydrogenase
MPASGAILALFLLSACNLGVPDPVVGPAPRQVSEQFIPEPPGYRLEPWVANLEAPWSLVFLPDGRALVSERPGRIRLIRDGKLEDAPYAGFEVVSGAGADPIASFLSVFADGEGGLMGLAVHPDFPRSRYVYAMHTYSGPVGVKNRIIRLRDEGDHGRFDRVILDGLPGWTFHNGGRIAFGPDGMLYVTTGETFEAELAQDLSSPAGKILRLTPDGGVPADNPFPNSPVYSYGHRNPQGLAWEPRSGELFASEHGPTGEFGLSARDEINVIAPAELLLAQAVGAPASSAIDRSFVWTTRAVPPATPPSAEELFVAALGSGALIRIRLAPNQAGYDVIGVEHWFTRGPEDALLGRLRDVVEGPDGALYILTSNRDGRGAPRAGDDHIYRLARNMAHDVLPKMGLNAPLTVRCHPTK